MTISLAILIGYLIVLLLSFLITVVTFVIWLCAKAATKEACANVLIVAASVCALAGLLSLPVIAYVSSRHEIPNMPNVDKPVSIETRADMAVNGIEKAQAGLAFARSYPALSFLPQFLEMQSPSKAQDSVKEFFQKLPDTEREPFAVATREAIFDHAIGKPFGKFLQSKDTGGTNEKLAFVTIIQNIDKPRAAKDLNDAVAVVQNQLPEGWYRYSALSSLYKSSGAAVQLQALSALQDEVVKQRMNRMAVGYLFVLTYVIGGILASIAFARFLKTNPSTQEDDNPLANCSIKRVYCMVLVVYYAQFLVGLPIGVAVGLSPALVAMTKEWTTAITAISFIANLILLLAATHWMLCKPLAVTLPEVLARLFRGNVAILLAWGLGGFCVLRTISLLYSLAVELLFRYSPSSINNINHQITEAAVHPNVLNILLLWFTIAMIVPIFEELFFRGTLYPVLKRRFGVLWAVAISAAIFAAYHLDPSSLPMLFGVGVGLAVIYEKTRSVLPCFVTHMLWNTSVILLTWIIR